MTNEALLTPVGIPRDTSVARTPQSDRFFLTMSISLLAIVLIGFSRTLYLRPLFQVPAIPWYVYVHGSVMTAWIVLLVVQTSLVAAHRTDLHRRLGILGTVLALAVVMLGAWLTLRIPANFKVTGDLSSSGGPTLPLPAATQIFFGDIGVMMLFPVLVATALWQRRHPEVHKRLMLLASMSMMGPALGRVTEFPALWGAAASSPATTWVTTLIVVLALGLPLSLVAHDLITARRLHRVTLWGVPAFLAVNIGAPLVAGTAAGPALWNALQ